MNTTDAIFQRALSKLLTEIFDGPPGGEAYLLNPGDPGLLRELESIDAGTASTRPMPGKTTIAAHVDHVHYGLTLLNRWAAGEANPWATADWNASWQRTTVTVDPWRTLRDRLRHEAETWQSAASSRTEWDDVSAAGALASAAHTAYHLGAIRQILAGMASHKSKTLSVSIDCPAERVYAFVSNPENLPKWATAFVRSVSKTSSGWVAETPAGPVGIEFVPANELGVLDHFVRPAPGVEILNPMRVVPNGAGSEVTFTLLRLPEMSDQKFAEDAGMVQRDLRTLKSVLEKDAVRRPLPESPRSSPPGPGR
ncbi:MAG: SRPBCC family protein [Pirellulales bacterium]